MTKTQERYLHWLSKFFIDFDILHWRNSSISRPNCRMLYMHNGVYLENKKYRDVRAKLIPIEDFPTVRDVVSMFNGFGSEMEYQKNSAYAVEPCHQLHISCKIENIWGWVFEYSHIRIIHPVAWGEFL